MPSPKWAKGTSGNPKGRPPGIGLSATIRAAIQQEMPTILQTLFEAARGGDVARR